MQGTGIVGGLWERVGVEAPAKPSARYQNMHLMSPPSGSSESAPRAKRHANSEQALASFWHCRSIVSGVSGMVDVGFLWDLVETS